LAGKVLKKQTHNTTFVCHLIVNTLADSVGLYHISLPGPWTSGPRD